MEQRAERVSLLYRRVDMHCVLYVGTHSAIVLVSFDKDFLQNASQHCGYRRDPAVLYFITEKGY